MVLAKIEPNETVSARGVPAVSLDNSGRRLLVKLDLERAEAEGLIGMYEVAVAALCLGPARSFYWSNSNYESLHTVLAAHGFHEYSRANELLIDSPRCRGRQALDSRRYRLTELSSPSA